MAGPERLERPGAWRAPEFLALAVILSLTALYAARRIWDIDIFWHIAAGRLFVQTRALTDHDTFSAIDPNRPWVALEWAYEILVYAVDRAGGLAAVRIMHAAIQWIAFALLWWSCRKKLRIGALGSLLILALTVLLYAERFRERPHVFNLLFEIILIPMIALGPPPASERRRSYLITALLFALWAGIHGGGAFLFLLAASTVPVAALIALALGVEGARDRVRWALPWYGSALVAALLTPTWARSVLHHVFMLEGSAYAIPEWAPTWRFFEAGTIPAHFFSGSFPTVVAVAWALSVAPILAAATRGRSALASALAGCPIERLALSLPLIVLSQTSIRFVYVSSFALLLLLPFLEERFRGLLPRRAAQGIGAATLLVLVGLAYQSRVLFVHGRLGLAIGAILSGKVLEESRYPIAQADFLARTGFEGSIYAVGDWGGYLLYRLWPRVLVTFDGRGNAPPEAIEDSLRVSAVANFERAESGPAIQAIYERYPVDAVLKPGPTWPRGFAPDPSRWKRVFGDGNGEIWIRTSPRGKVFLDRLAAQGL